MPTSSVTKPILFLRCPWMSRLLITVKDRPGGASSWLGWVSACWCTRLPSKAEKKVCKLQCRDVAEGQLEAVVGRHVDAVEPDANDVPATRGLRQALAASRPDCLTRHRGGFLAATRL